MLFLKRIVSTWILVACIVPACRLSAQDGLDLTPALERTEVRLSVDENGDSGSTENAVKQAVPELVFSPRSTPQDDLSRRLEAAERRILELEQDREHETLRPISQQILISDPAFNKEVIGGVEPCEDCELQYPRFYVDYDHGFVIRPYDKEETPFELKVRSRMQFAYTGFKRDVNTWTGNDGITRPVDARNDFEIERGRLDFAGYFFDPKLQFYINIDADTDDRHSAIFHDFWVNYEFSKAFNLYVGKAFVPGSRDWLNGSTTTHLSGRSLATSFFRPDRSVGVWAIGEPVEDFHYRAMVANGFNTTDLRPRSVDDQLMYSASVWWDPLGDYGKGYADLENHERLVVRLGNSFTHAAQKQRDFGVPRLEPAYARLSDGTPLIFPNALAPGRTVSDFDTYLYAVDFAAKYQGWSLNSEYFFRWLTDFSTLGGSIATKDLYTDGFYVDTGYMLVEKKLELVGRVSTIDGFFGDSWEYAVGFNWYINGAHSNKLTFDVAVLDGSPVNNSGPNYEVGQDGILYRMHWQVATY